MRRRAPMLLLMFASLLLRLNLLLLLNCGSIMSWLLSCSVATGAQKVLQVAVGTELVRLLTEV